MTLERPRKRGEVLGTVDEDTEVEVGRAKTHRYERLGWLSQYRGGGDNHLPPFAHVTCGQGSDGEPGTVNSRWQAEGALSSHGGSLSAGSQRLVTAVFLAWGTGMIM